MGKHYVPQEYLRGFSADPERSNVWMFDKTSRAWSCAAIKQVAQTRDYYPADVEARLFAEVEGPGHLALTALRRGSVLIDSERESLAYYIAVLVMRGPRQRRRGRELVPVVLDTTISELRNELVELRTAENSDRITCLLSDIERIEQKYRVKTPSTVHEQIESPWPSTQVFTAIMRMTWRIVRIPSDRFLVTTDNPVYFFDSYGLGTDRAELSFPIDSHSALLGSHQGKAGATLTMVAKPTLVKEVNRRVTSGAERFVFSPRQEKWIETLSLRVDPYLSRIKW
jgi:hypothetical protein